MSKFDLDPRLVIPNSEITIDYSLPILFGKGWNCCTKDNATNVIVFDNGARWAVCKGCANQYTGPVFSLGIFAPETFVDYIMCQCENSKCEHSVDEDICFNNANTGKTIPFSGSVCDGCYSKYEECNHLNMLEIGMVGHYGDTVDCGYGCKIVKCEKCNAEFESHRTIYGCKKDAQAYYPI